MHPCILILVSALFLWMDLLLQHIVSFYLNIASGSVFSILLKNAQVIIQRFRVLFKIRPAVSGSGFSVIFKKCPGYYSASGSRFRVLFKIRPAASGSGFSVLFKSVQEIIQRLVHDSRYYSKYDLQRLVQDSAYY